MNSKTYIEVTFVKCAGRKRKALDVKRDFESRTEYQRLVRSDNPYELASELERNHMKKMKTEAKSSEDLKQYHREMRAMYKQAVKTQSFTKVRTVKKAIRRKPTKALDGNEKKINGVEYSLINAFDSGDGCSDYRLTSSQTFDELSTMFSKFQITPGVHELKDKVNDMFLVTEIVKTTKDTGVAKDFDVITKGLKRTHLSKDDADDFEHVQDANVNKNDDDDFECVFKCQRHQC